MRRDAVLSPCGLYRYLLVRAWSAAPALTVCMLNPSKADADVDDPTATRVIGFARRLGYGSVLVVNLRAWRATDPKDLPADPQAIGPCNDEWIMWALMQATGFICAWGANGRGDQRVEEVLELARVVRPDLAPTGLAFTADGIPRHPLYLRNDCEPRAFPKHTARLRSMVAHTGD